MCSSLETQAIIRFEYLLLPQAKIAYGDCNAAVGRMHSDAQLTLFSSFSLGKINKFLLRSLVRRFAGSSSVPAHVEMMGFLGIGQVMCK